MTTLSPYNTIGKSIGRAEGPGKVTGKALFTADIKLPGTLVGKCLRSPYPYARLISIDTSAAKKLKGVHAVITRDDVPDTLVGRNLCDIAILAQDIVRFAGQKVAAVAADDSDIADEALSLIEVEYESLEPITDVLDAFKPDAPILHPNLKEYKGVGDFPRDHPNIAVQQIWKKGDIEEGFQQADLVFEHTFKTQHQHHGYIEPHATTLMIDEKGIVQVWINSKVPFMVRKQLAEGIGLPENKICINPTIIGGDFGGKGGFMDSHVAYYLAKQTKRPIRMVMNYNEELTASNPRHPATMVFKTGVLKDGTIVARHAKLMYNGGGSAGFHPFGSTLIFGSRCLGPYRIAHSKIDSSIVYTNLTPCGSMRAPGDPQSYFAGEAQMDLIARELGMEPYDFRKKNILHDGDETPLGFRWERVAVSTILDRCIQEADMNKERPTKPGKKIGRGMALCERLTGAGESIAKLSIDTTGQVTLKTALKDQGAGLYTILRQIVGRELDIPFNEIKLETWTTDAIAFDKGISGARASNVGGNAALGAAKKIKGFLAKMAAKKWGCPIDEIEFKKQQVIHKESGIPLVELMKNYGDTIETIYTHEAPMDNKSTVFSAQAAEVEIDEETGAIQVNQITTVHDVGTIVNPISHQGQINGSIMQGLGAALIEGLQFDEGRVTNANLGEYKLPVMADIPPIKTVLIKDKKEGPIPFGGKAIGEQAISGIAPAIVNAILDATAISMTQLPVTSEAMLEQLDKITK